MEDNNKVRSLNEKVDLLLELAAQGNLKKKEKKFSLPFISRINNKKAKQGWATFLVIKENRNVDFKKFPIEEQTTVIEGAPRLATPEDALFYKGKPFYILPSWSVEPFSPTKNYNKTIDEQKTAQGYRLLMNRMQMSKIETKKKFGGAWILLVLVGLVVLGYFFMKSRGGL